MIYSPNPSNAHSTWKLLPEGFSVKPIFPDCSTADKFYLVLATGFGSGYSPFASGTAGSAVAILLYLLIHPLLSGSQWVLGLVFLLGVLALSIRCSDVAEKYFGKKDDGRIVIDEFLGQWVALYLIPFSWWAPVAAFFLFRFFDIVKPFPAGRSQRLPGGLGIVLDDVFAGIYSNLALQVVILRLL